MVRCVVDDPHAGAARPADSSLASRSTCSVLIFFFSSRRRHTRFDCDWSSDVCSSDLKAIQEKFGDKVETSFVESVPESADAERVMRDMAGQGNKLIFATSFGYQEFVQKVAADLKDVKFEHATGYKNADNVATYDTKTFEGAYLAGIVAGGMTKTKTVGVVASVPIPEVVRNINSFVLGAQSVDPSIKAKVGALEGLGVVG